MGEKYRTREKPSRNALAEKGITLDELKEAYKKSGSIRRGAVLVGLSTNTFHNHLRNAGFTFKKVGKPNFHRNHTSIVASWLRKNPTVNLPRNYKEMADIMDIDISTVRAYFKRRQDRLQAIKEQHNDLIDLPIFGIPDVNGHTIVNKIFKKMNVSIDNFALNYIIDGITLSGNKYRFIVTLNDYLDYFGVEQ